MKNQPIIGLLPAQAVEVEKALLRNIIMQGASAIDELAPMLRSPQLFYNDTNRLLFETVMQLYADRKTIDLLTISDELMQSGAVDGASYVVDLIAKETFDVSLSDYSNADYVDILQQKYVRRTTTQALIKYQQLLIDETLPIDEATNVLERFSTEISEVLHGADETPSLKDVVKKSYQMMQHRMKSAIDGKITGINTGFKKLNNELSGWQNGELVVIAARPSMGKTAIALHFTKMAARHGFPVLFFSLEMADYKLTDRLILGETAIDPHDFRHGKINQYDNAAFLAAADDLGRLPVYIDEKSGVDVDYIVSRSRVAARKQGVKMIVIDYLQLIVSKEQRGQTRDQEIGKITRRLKQLSKELDLPVILLSQLNRAVEGRTSKIPSLADLRESGNIEQDADIVMLLFRPAYYKLESHGDIEADGVLWIMSEKSRNGDIGQIPVKHNISLTKFFDYDR